MKLIYNNTINNEQGRKLLVTYKAIKKAEARLPKL